MGNQYHDSILEMMNQYVTGIDMATITSTSNNTYTSYSEYLDDNGLYRRRN